MISQTEAPVYEERRGLRRVVITAGGELLVEYSVGRFALRRSQYPLTQVSMARFWEARVGSPEGPFTVRRFIVYLRTGTPWTVRRNYWRRLDWRRSAPEEDWWRGFTDWKAFQNALTAHTKVRVNV